MERDFLAAIGRERQHQQREKPGREESAYFGAAAAGAPAMDWSFASKPGTAPSLMSFRSAAREEPTFPQFAAFDGAKNTAPRILTHQRSFGADSQQYAAVHRAQPPQHALNGARVIPVSSPFNQNNPMFRVHSSPSIPNGTAGPFKQPPFAMNNAANNSTVGVYGTRDALKPKTAQLTIFYAGSVNVFDNVSAEKAQELMFLAGRGSLPSSAPVARKPETPIFAPAKVTVPEPSPAKQMVFQKPPHVSSPPPAISKPIPSVLQAATAPRSASSCNLDSPLSSRSSRLPFCANATTSGRVTMSAEWMPGQPRPAHLDGSSPGDFGFDPLGLATVPENFERFKESEVYHCRWAMLAVPGILVPEALGLGNWVKAQEWAAVPGGQATYLGNPVPWGTLPTILVIEFVAIAFAEHQRTMEKDPEKKKYPGGAFDPLGFSKDPVKFEEYKLKEIKNGRLAMLAFVGFCVQQSAYPGTGPLENLATHLADPWHNNIGDIIIPRTIYP